METLIINHEVQLYMVRADSFPDGVMQAHDRLRMIAPAKDGRVYYGISYPGQDGKIMYWAAANELYAGELKDSGTETFTIVKGAYLYIDVADFMQHVQAIGEAFRQILADSRIAPDGCCIEQYMGDKDCRCMVRTR